jgi:rubrerythrin
MINKRYSQDRLDEAYDSRFTKAAQKKEYERIARQIEWDAIEEVRGQNETRIRLLEKWLIKSAEELNSLIIWAETERKEKTCPCGDCDEVRWLLEEFIEKLQELKSGGI